MKNRRWVIIARITTVVLTAIAAVLLFPPLLVAEELSFFPRIMDTAGSVEVAVTNRDSKTTTGDRRQETSQDTSAERIRLAAAGYVYHPRFMIFSATGAGGLEQDSFTTQGTSFRTASFTDEYELRTTILPEHPYNLDLFTRRSMAPASTITGERTIDSSEGASFRYRERPASLQLSVVTDSIKGHDTFDATTYTAGGSYLIGPFRNAVGHTLTDSTSSDGTRSSRTNSYFNNELKLDAVILNSGVNDDRQRQTSLVAPSLDTGNFLWSEHLSVQLPFNFSTDLQHEYRKNSATNGPSAPSFAETTSLQKTTMDGGIITHRLYESLLTSVSENRIVSETLGGDTESDTQAFAFNYTKRIPSGNMNAGYTFQRMSLAQTGAPTVGNEVHATAVPGVFTLNNQAADQATISILIKDPVTQNLTPLVRDVNYEVIDLGNSLEIAILSIPASINPPAPPAVTFDFLVAYSLQANKSKMKTVNNGFNLGFTLLDGLFNPYYSHFISRQEVVEGAIPGGPDAITSDTFGYTVQKQPFLFLAEYSDLRSRLSPSRTLKTFTDYREFISQDVDVSSRLSFNYVTHGAVETVQNGRAFSEKITGLEATIHRVFPRDKLNLFAGASFTDRRVINAVARSYALNTSLTWRVGRLDVAASISKGYTTSAGTISHQTIETTAYNLTVSRKLF